MSAVRPLSLVGLPKLPVGSKASGERRRGGATQARLARGAFIGFSLAAATLILIVVVGPSSTKPGAVERRNQAAAQLLHTVLAGTSMYTKTAAKNVALKHVNMLEGGEERGEHREGEHGEHREGEHGEHGEHGEGSEREGEGEEEADEAAILERWGFFFVTIIIVFSVSFELGVETIKESVPEQLLEVVSALLEELTTLGFLGFAFFLFTVPIDQGESLIEIASLYSLHEKEALKELFEGLHYLVFFVSLSFILGTVAGLASFQYTENRQWTEFEQDGIDAFTKPELLQIPTEDLNVTGAMLLEWRKPLAILKAEYLRFRCRFIANSVEPTLEPDFEFLKYMQESVSETFCGMIKITAYDWLVTWLLLCLFFGISQEVMSGGVKGMIALYAYILTTVLLVCLVIQAKLIWIKTQLLPRVPSEMQSEVRYAGKNILAPVMMDQTSVDKNAFDIKKYIPAFFPKKVTKVLVEWTKVRPGNKHERLFWLSSLGPEVMSHMIRLSMFWSIISLATLMSHHMPGITRLGTEVTGYRFLGHCLFWFIASMHVLCIAIVYRNANIFTFCSSVEMMVDREMVEAIVRKQKFAKCQTAIDMLFTLNFYMQQAKWLKEQAELDTDQDGNTSKRSMPAFVPKDVTEEKAYEELKELFEHFDSDGSGELGSDEVGELLATMGVNLNAEELAKLIQMMDKDGSGALNVSA